MASAPRILQFPDVKPDDTFEDNRVSMRSLPLSETDYYLHAASIHLPSTSETHQLPVKLSAQRCSYLGTPVFLTLHPYTHVHFENP